MPQPEPILDVRDIQGNILAGFNKDFQVILGLEIADTAAVKTWLASIHCHVSSTLEVLHFNRSYRLVRSRTHAEPVGMIATWLNLAFSHEGIAKLTSRQEADELPDEAFRIGMPLRSGSILGDSLDPASASHPANWKVGGPGRIPDILMIVASDRESATEELLALLLSAEGSAGLNTIYRENGATRSDLPGHEHFGFKDGISQPGIRGRVSATSNDFLTPREISSKDALAAAFSRPGQPLVMPGHFVLGYETQHPKTGEPLPPVELAHDWYRNGAFLVFRRLRQDVALFHSFLRHAAATLSNTGGFGGIDEARLGATFVGRWPGGEPIVRTPNGPNSVMARETAANAFAFAEPMPLVTMRKGITPDAAPPSPGDPLATTCPHWSHIRKINPRDDQTDIGDAFDTLTRRILRRGTPYGPPIVDRLVDDGVDRGLLFLAYHASIEQSFEKLTQDWANQTSNPSPNGHDPIIGQTNLDNRRRIVSMPVPAGLAVDMFLEKEWVSATGGGYFFAPSLAAIAGRLASSVPTGSAAVPPSLQVPAAYGTGQASTDPSE